MHYNDEQIHLTQWHDSIGKARNPFIAYTEHIQRESTWTRLYKIPRDFSRPAVIY